MRNQSDKESLNISIFSHPIDSASRESELRMIKTALLYGDSINLYSMPAAMWVLGDASFDKPLQDRLQRLLNLENQNDPQQSSDLAEVHALVETYDTLRAKRIKTRRETLLLQEVTDKLEKVWNEKIGFKRDWLRSFGVPELKAAIQSGLVSLLGQSLVELNHETLWHFMKRQLDLVEELPTLNTYPFFESNAVEMLAPLLEQHTPMDGRSHQVALADNLLSRLPQFESASVNEILDIRRELEKPLVRFRSAIIDFADTTKSEVWDNSFVYDAEKLFRRSIEPAILEIEELVESNKSLASLVIKELGNRKLESGTALVLMLSSLASIPLLAGAAVTLGGLTAASVAALAMWDGSDKWKEQQQALKQNRLYFYYRSRELLADGTYRYSRNET